MKKRNGYSIWTIIVVIAIVVMAGGILLTLSNQNQITPDERETVPGIGGGPETSPSPTDSPSPTPDESPMIFPDSDPDTPAFR